MPAPPPQTDRPPPQTVQPADRPAGRGQAARRPVAVALKYELGTQSLPRIVATGKGTVAEQILELAFANGVKVREDADLVEVLSAIEIDSDIPVEAIAAVAEILAHVYRANGTLPSAPPTDGRDGNGEADAP